MVSKELLPLALMYVNNGEIKGRTRLQKLLFLLQREGGISLEDEFEFFPYDYGPFSKDLCEVMDKLDVRDSVDVEEHSKPRGKQYDYSLTEEGKERLREEISEDGELIEAMNDLVREFSEMPIMGLIDYVYANYPEMARKSVLG